MSRLVANSKEAIAYAVSMAQSCGIRVVQGATEVSEVNSSPALHAKDGNEKRFWRVKLGILTSNQPGNHITGLPDILDTLVTSTGRVFHWPRSNDELQSLFTYEDSQRAWNELLPCEDVTSKPVEEEISGSYLDELFRQQYDRIQRDQEQEKR